MALTHEYDQILEIDKSEIVNDAHVNSVLPIFLEAKLLHHRHAQYIVAEVILVYHERQIPRVLSQENQNCLFRLDFAAELFCFADIEVA